ncbi:MAG: DUF2848 domain-containing protein [Limimaricola sp.]|uniref:DUF2848 domain-containing protein n=1 Tax=Limimaricola sp. TaxID=2211665 RepID=UPI001D929498|nr:DUF2848 domain-containing protein [Limimaricola sp.]MBI1416783.1 DUF2848 domain-containing protein [Limimaricola sp.]
MELPFHSAGKAMPLSPTALIVAGWTGRDQAAIAHHIEELAALGVPAPSSTPLYYRAAAALLTTAPMIEVVGPDTSGEAEPMIVIIDGQSYIGLASDHTDRALEAHSVALSKQICAKPCAPELWPWETVADRFDDIALDSWIEDDGAWVAYQSGTLAALRPLATLLERSRLGDLAAEGSCAMLCGTLPTIGGVRPAARFRMRLRDPASGREITHSYETRALPKIA